MHSLTLTDLSGNTGFLQQVQKVQSVLFILFHGNLQLTFLERIVIFL